MQKFLKKSKSSEGKNNKSSQSSATNRYIENRAKEIMSMYEKSGRRKDISQLRENLKQAMVFNRYLIEGLI